MSEPVPRDFVATEDESTSVSPVVKSKSKELTRRQGDNVRHALRDLEAEPAWRPTEKRESPARESRQLWRQHVDTRLLDKPRTFSGALTDWNIWSLDFEAYTHASHAAGLTAGAAETSSRLQKLRMHFDEKGQLCGFCSMSSNPETPRDSQRCLDGTA